MASISCLVLSLLWSAQAPMYQSRALVVRAVDQRTGKPVKGKVVRVQFLDGPVQPRGQYLERKTDAQGRAFFDLPSPLPKTVEVFLEFRSWRQCSPDTYKLPEVLQTGVVGDDACSHTDKHLGHYPASPGEIVVFARYITLDERLKGFPV